MPYTCGWCTIGVLSIKLKTHVEVVTGVHLQLTFVRDQRNNPHAVFFFFLCTALVFLSPASMYLSPTPDNEERGPVVKSYLKKKS